MTDVNTSSFKLDVNDLDSAVITLNAIYKLRGTPKVLSWTAYSTISRGLEIDLVSSFMGGEFLPIARDLSLDKAFYLVVHLIGAAGE